MQFLLDLNWLVVGQIILIDILLGGDNAIVIALACRNLPLELRFRGILWGTVGAIAIRIALIAFAVMLLQTPYVKMLGGLLLLWIGVKLLLDSDKGHGEINASERLISAIKTIMVADLIMSLDNVVAVATAAELGGGEHQLALVVFGILVSIPIIVWGSTIVLKLMERFPVIITLGAALLGYLGGTMIFSDIVFAKWIHATPALHDIVLPILQSHLSLPGLIGAASVVIAGNLMGKRSTMPFDKR